MMAANKKIILIIVILALVVGGAFYLLKRDRDIQLKLEPPEKEEPTTFGEKIYEMVQNPAEKIPQTNPFKAKINPFEGLKINPFE